MFLRTRTHARTDAHTLALSSDRVSTCGLVRGRGTAFPQWYGDDAFFRFSLNLTSTST